METAILLGLQSLRFDGLTQLMALISALGNKAFIWILIALILCIFRDKRIAGILILAAIAVCFVGSEVILEKLVHRVRPCDAGIGVDAVMGVSHSGFSFPSGHAVSSFAAATVIALQLGKRYATPAFIGAVLIAFSRLFLGVHYPSDVLGGALIGALIGLLVVIVYNNFFSYGARERTAPAGEHTRRR